jgi:hypothetical protein
MNPYWINPAPDTAEWLDSQRLKREFYFLSALHIVLWIAALAGIACTYTQVQKTSPIEAYTSEGEPAWGKPLPLGNADTLEQQETFTQKHLQQVVEYLFMRTEKGGIPELSEYADHTLLAIFAGNFSFAAHEKGGYFQSFKIEQFNPIFRNNQRRIYRVKGMLSSHSLEKSSNTPLYLVVAFDKRTPTAYNPSGWVAWVVKAIDDKEFYASETANLIKEATQTQSENQSKNQPKESTP